MLAGRLELMAAGAAGLIVLFTTLWARQKRTRDASLVDVGWALSLGLLAIGYALGGSGAPLRRLVLAALVGTWSFRLAFHIYWRHRGGPEDGRYQTLRERWGANANRYFFWFFQAQGALALVLSVPFLLIAFNPTPSVHPLEWLAVALVATGVAGESVADAQLSRHRNDPRNRGKTCRRGLWHYSRHPNYFFEWLIWCGYALAALPAPYGWLALLSPALMLFLILNVTGIPPTEERALRTRGDDYRAYQASTSAFVPWFPKKESLT